MNYRVGINYKNKMAVIFIKKKPDVPEKLASMPARAIIVFLFQKKGKWDVFAM